MARQTQTKKETLLPSLQPGNRSLSRYTSPLAVENGVGRDGEHMLQEASKHQLAMRLIGNKTVGAMREDGKVQVSASQIFREVCEGVDAVGKVAEESESKRYIDQFAHFLKDQGASHLAALYDDCAERLRAEAARPISLSAPEEKRGLWQVLKGE